MFDFLVAIGQVDGNLADELKRLLVRANADGDPEKWDLDLDVELDRGIADRYRAEFVWLVVLHDRG